MPQFGPAANSAAIVMASAAGYAFEVPHKEPKHGPDHS